MNDDLVARLTHPIAAIGDRTPREVFDIMSDRFRGTLTAHRDQLARAEAERDEQQKAAWNRVWSKMADADRRATTAEDQLARVEAERDAALEALKDTLAHLVAATSLLKRSPKKAAPSDCMFDQMIADYEASITRGRAAIAAYEAHRVGEVVAWRVVAEPNLPWSFYRTEEGSRFRGALTSLRDQLARVEAERDAALEALDAVSPLLGRPAFLTKQAKPDA